MPNAAPGPDSAFDALLAAVQQRLFAWLLALTGNAVDARDVLQQTNLILWRKSDRQTLMAACSRCHGSVDVFFTGRTRTGLAMIVPGHPGESPLWLRLSGDNPCGHSLPLAEKLRLLEWIAGGQSIIEAS
jgi:hypothetical protein